MPALITLLIRAWVPESPRWLIRMGRVEEARQALAWALQTDPASIQLPTTIDRSVIRLGASCSAIRAACCCPR